MPAQGAPLTHYIWDDPQSIGAHCGGSDGLGSDRRLGGKTMQVGEDGRSVSLNVRVWLESDGSIRLTSEAEPSLRVIIKNDPDRPLGHPTLFKRLAHVLRSMAYPPPRDNRPFWREAA